MAGREKKPALLKKQMLSPVPSKEGEPAVDTSTNKTNPVKSEVPKLETVTQTESASTLKQVKKPRTKTPIKKNLKINFKTKTKKTKKLKLSKSLFKTNKLNIDSKNLTLIKNGIKNKRKPKPKLLPVNDNINSVAHEQLSPPILEPMTTTTTEENNSVKKETKKRTKKAAQEESADNAETSDKKTKLNAETIAKETVEDVLNDVANELQIDFNLLMKKPAKKKAPVKKKLETTPKIEEIKSPKKNSPKKLKPETKLKKSIKKEVIDTMCKDITLDPDAQNVINNLDLNVTKTAKKTVKKRRHSIEKIPAVEEIQNNATFEQPFVLFTNTRRSSSPRSKRNSKIRKSIDTTVVSRRFSPYTTRSDSPARILRNGKHRKLKDSQLLEGLDSEYKKRKRLCSEYSGSEISKCSGYLSESDSSFSDLASIQENGAIDGDSPPKEESLTKSDLLKKEILESIKITPASPEGNEMQNLNIKQISTKITAILKRSLSTDTSQISESIINDDVKPKLNDITDIGVSSFTDTNSNDVKLQVKTEIAQLDNEDMENSGIKTESVKSEVVKFVKLETLEDEKISENIASSPSEKVPDKSIILDQMKQVFNDSIDETEKRATRSSRRNLKLDEEKMNTITPIKFYGTEIEQNSLEPVNEKESIGTQKEMEEEVQDPIENLEENSVNMEQDEELETVIEKDDILLDTNENLKQEKEDMNESTEELLGIETEVLNVQQEDNTEDELLLKLKENSSLSISVTELNKNDVPVEEANGDNNLFDDEEEEIDVEGNSMECDNKIDQMPVIEETPENQAIKENILNALGLQSLKAAEEAKQRDKQKTQVKPDAYTGTLKTVIKLNRQGDRKKRNPLKMTLQKSKTRNLKDGDGDNSKSDGTNGKSDGENSCYKVMKEGSSSGWRHGSHSSDTAGANRKSHYSNRSNMDGSSEHASDGDDPSKEGESSGTKALVIPEKASSFSIHPDRLCSDECAYCFGKFGLFDTPLHIAQIKSVERQNKILENEIYLMRDSCLCDACYRHVDRRLNSGSAFNNKNYKRNSSVLPNNLPRQNNCHVQDCERESSHVLRRKWLIKMRKSVSRVINIDLEHPGLHSIPICSEHYAAVEHLMVCALCKRRLARNHIHYLGLEWNNLNTALEKEGIPVKLTDKPVVCKLCRYFASLLLKPSGEIKNTTAGFFKQYKKRLLHFHDIEVMDEAEAEEPISVPIKEKSEKEILKKTKKSKPSKNTRNCSTETVNSAESQAENKKTDQSRVPSNSENGESRASTPNSDAMVDIETLVPNMVLECASDAENSGKSEVPNANKSVYKKLQLPESVREAVEISKIMKFTNNNRNKTTVVERLGSNPSISVRQLFPGEEDLPLQASIDFNAIKERTPEGWEKSTCTIQYDVDTKHLWQELQKPYGNQSSFLRHLILLEKYFRNGDLTLSPNASHHAVNYSVSVQNRLRAYDNIPTNSLPMQPLTMLPFNQIKKSQSGIISSKDPVQNVPSIVNAANIPKNTPIPISQLNPNFLTQLSVRQKSPGVPPGLISLQPGTNRPVAPLLKMSQKFKLPIGKNWRPTLIPVNQSKGSVPNASSGDGKRITGLVQVISNGKPYHISLQDYNRMCAMKKNSEIKQKAAEAKLKQREPEVSASSVLKPVVPRKPKNTVANTGNKASPIVSTVPKETTITESSKHIADRIKDTSQSEIRNTVNKPVMILPKIPKSLTVIPQTIARKPLQSSSPTLSITTKPSTSKS